METTTRADLDIKEDIADQLEWAHDIPAAGIGISVHGGTVTLSGVVGSPAERTAVVGAAQRVRGVRTIIDDLTLAAPLADTDAADAALARDVNGALRRRSRVPSTITATVDRGRATLRGEAEWDYQREVALHTAQDVEGVSSVTDLIGVRHRPSPADTHRRIAEALTRDALSDSDAIDVTVNGTKVTLTGRVRSRAQWRRAAEVASSSPYVTEIDNRLTVV